jgi:dephospho-CoA kinase
MLKVGLTGGIASGKSVVGEMFVALGAHLIQADGIAHELMLPGKPVYQEVVRNFGREILDPDLTINRAKLAEAAFGKAPAKPTTASELSTSGTPPRVEELNHIVHPAVIRRQEEWMEEVGRQHPDSVAIVEAALILESGAAKRFDRLIVVTCTDEQRAARFAMRQKIPIEAARREVARRMAVQIPEREKVKAADYVIDNSGTVDQTQDQVRRVWHLLRP